LPFGALARRHDSRGRNRVCIRSEKVIPDPEGSGKRASQPRVNRRKPPCEGFFRHHKQTRQHNPIGLPRFPDNLSIARPEGADTVAQPGGRSAGSERCSDLSACTFSPRVFAPEAPKDSVYVSFRRCRRTAKGAASSGYTRSRKGTVLSDAGLACTLGNPPRTHRGSGAVVGRIAACLNATLFRWVP
jgi:hypothetical protein